MMRCAGANQPAASSDPPFTNKSALVGDGTVEIQMEQLIDDLAAIAAATSNPEQVYYLKLIGLYL